MSANFKELVNVFAVSTSGFVKSFTLAVRRKRVVLAFW